MDNDKDNLNYFALEKALHIRNFEIDNFWKRGWFFGALFISLLTINLSIISKGFVNYSIYISFLLLLITIFQSLMNRGSKYWQERWEYKVKNIESSLGIDITLTEQFDRLEHDYINACILAKGENRLARATRFSVSKITILIWDLLVASSLLFWINDILVLSGLEIQFLYKIIVFHIFLFLYIFFFLINSSWHEPLKPKGKNIFEEKSRAYILNKIDK